MEKVQSIRGKQKIMHNGYIYVKQKDLAAGVISYECEKRQGNVKGVSECKAKIKVKNDLVVRSLHEHTHMHQIQLDVKFCKLDKTLQEEQWKQKRHLNRFLAGKCRI